ncbi:diaminobutyrate acetyltransferase [Rhodococcoides kroppenstedtii]|uniref:diaminobutyrate acetyltransferase n=1 Tax=Rhodococcoides kroppenstedtii TaxID=293050 RepID=UPI001427B415|nr:diaminobutyrate acetyltransferase [Rhodococcus kroppenstedtii]MBY6436998.1 diaminobutyrate acetyltransferase [Rhodococcus kroppenstedtii]NIL80099.1 L-2,4-diaminobutyric acid acetyltransferase [Rhodococcus kroppenstedtii]
MTPVLQSATSTPPDLDSRHEYRPPTVDDGVRLWEMARDSEVLDVNSSYSYLLWCRDFAATSVVAVDGGNRPVGFVTGYLRPDAPRTVFVWQVAVDAAHRGRGLARGMLDSLVDRVVSEHGVTTLETTVSPDNAASIATFTSLARRRGTGIVRSDLFAAGSFPDAHQPEDLYTVGPFAAPTTDSQETS